MYNHYCYRKTLSILNIVTLLNCMQYNGVQQGSDYTAHFSSLGYTSIDTVLQKLKFLKIICSYARIYLTFWLYELYFVYNAVHKALANNKLQKVRTSQLWHRKHTRTLFPSVDIDSHFVMHVPSDPSVNWPIGHDPLSGIRMRSDYCISKCVTVPNCVSIGQAVAEYGDLSIFSQDGGRPPYWICDADVWTTDKGHMVVLITVQNFGWNRRCSLDNMHSLVIFCEIWLENSARPKIVF